MGKPSAEVPAADLRADDSEEEEAEVRNIPDGHPAVSSGRLAARCPFLAQAEEGAHSSRPARPVPLNVIDRKHHPSEATRDLLASIGGRDRLLAVTSRFYPKMFRDRQLSLFVQNFEDPHPERLADWIAEKMSGRAYWSSQLSSRQPDQPQDRSHAHYLAWHSPKRPRSQWGDHFKLDDAIMWMRLMFWSCREEGLDSEPFLGWYTVHRTLHPRVLVQGTSLRPCGCRMESGSRQSGKVRGGRVVDEGRRRHGQVGGGICVLARNPLCSWRTRASFQVSAEQRFVVGRRALQRNSTGVWKEAPAEIGEGISPVSGTLH